jgi:aspartyl-tRNA(Asn)/glutamyl-tRNA(Gln) amidotransferase subunit A
VYPRFLNVFLGLHVEGFITRTVRDAALLMNVASGHDLRDPESIPGDADYLSGLEYGIEGKRFAYSLDLGYAVVDPDVERVFMDSLRQIEKAGGVVEEAGVKLPDVSNYLRVKVTHEIIVALGDRLNDWVNKMYPLYRGFMRFAQGLSLDDYVRAQGVMNELWGRLWRLFRDYHYLVTPTTAVPPFRLDEAPGPRTVGGADVGPLGWMPFTYPFNFTKQPAASLPMGLTPSGLPVGVQIVGRPLDDLGVLQASRALEERVRWYLRRPGL